MYVCGFHWYLRLLGDSDIGRGSCSKIRTDFTLRNCWYHHYARRSAVAAIDFMNFVSTQQRTYGSMSVLKASWTELISLDMLALLIEIKHIQFD